MIRSPQCQKFFACALGLALSVLALGCAPDRPAPVGVASDAEKSTPASPEDAAPNAPSTVVEEIGERVPQAPKVEAVKGLAPLDASCAVDSDCEVKDVGNCCGRMPACVNHAAKPHDAAAVQRECERTGTSSICGFQELSGCRCEASRCVGVPSVGDGGGDVR